MISVSPNLWSLARSGQAIDCADFATALKAQLSLPVEDFRTQLLIRDSLDALRDHWGEDRMRTWVASLPDRSAAERAWQADVGDAGFASIGGRLMDATRSDVLLQFFRDLGSHLTTPARIEVGRSAALILSVGLTRHTDDVDAVDELPAVIRNDHALLDQLVLRYGLRLGHFQSHYLPDGWRDRVRSLDRFGKLDVLLVDPVDVLLSKLFSARTKDLDDLRAAVPTVGREALADRFLNAGRSLVSEAKLRANAERNWYVLFGQPLPA